MTQPTPETAPPTVTIGALVHVAATAADLLAFLDLTDRDYGMTGLHRLDLEELKRALREAIADAAL